MKKKVKTVLICPFQHTLQNILGYKALINRCNSQPDCLRIRLKANATPNRE